MRLFQPLTFGRRCCPEGTSENSPAIYRWEHLAVEYLKSHRDDRVRRQISFGRPYGTSHVSQCENPAVKLLGYSHRVPPGRNANSAACSRINERYGFTSTFSSVTLFCLALRPWCCAIS